MSAMAEETAGLKKKFMAGEQMLALLEKRVEELREENNALRQTSMGKDAEIRHLNDQITELFLKLRLVEQNSVGLLTQLKHQTESEAVIVRAQKDQSSTLMSLHDKCNKLMNENQDLRSQLVTQKADLEREMEMRNRGVEELKQQLEDQRDKLVPRDELERLQATYSELLAKHRKLLKVHISGVLEDRNIKADKDIFDAGSQLDSLASQIAQLRNTNA